MQNWMIYGVTGYTGRLMAAEAAARGLRPVLAGRSREAVESLGASLGLPTRVFDLAESADALAAHLEGMQAVLHCAGPFSHTSEPMLRACLAVGAHYLDITGELAVFEQVISMHDAIVKAGVTAVSGTGFDVVPTDCLAAMLKRELPDATWLRLAIHGPKAISAGTAKSIIEGLSKGSSVRHDGQMKQVSATYRTLEVPFDERRSTAVSVALGDLVTAYRSTGISNIETFLRADAGTLLAMRCIEPFTPVLASEPVQGVLKSFANWFAVGPSTDELAKGRAVVWGEVENARGHKVSMRLHTPDAYALTVTASLAAVRLLLDGQVPKGAQTPAMAFGADFVLSLPDVRVETLSSPAAAAH